MARLNHPNAHYQDPMDCMCDVSKIEPSGNKTYHTKCWWYNDKCKRKFKSFAHLKYGVAKARQLAYNHLLMVNQ